MMLICVPVLILKHDLFNYFHIGNVSTQNNVDEPGPQLVVEPPPQGLFPSVNVNRYRRMPRSSSPVWLISEVKNVFVTV